MSESRTKQPETEKITINLGYVDLGQIDLLVQEGFYSNRTDLIRTAIRNELSRHVDVLRQSAARRTLVLGLQEFSKADLEAVRKSGTRLRIQALGLVRIADDVPPSLADKTIESIAVLGALQASPAVKAVLADRIK
jgi:Arc/MetJ-type ribon-helix-helix transcriptional regulator